jgi:poly(3-hydroxybutyrate) depolymerase
VVGTDQISVSGLSSGGFMAVQVHVAFSATFKAGASIVAGGPYDCAQGRLSTALGPCTADTGSRNVPQLISITRSRADAGSLDNTVNLEQSKVYLYSGTQDSVVRQAVMNDLQTYYQSFVNNGNIIYKNNIASQHAMITDDYGNSCSTLGSPYINNCNFDLAGAILQQIYGALNARNNGTLGGTFIEFNQGEFIPGGTGHGMAPTGWIYVPARCAAGQSCKLHVVLHGCQQNTATIGDRYYMHTGYNRWADTNDIIVLYPQTGTGATNGCWDWWGYDDANYAVKTGPQMVAVKAMVDRIKSRTPPSKVPPPMHVAVGQVTDTSIALSWTAEPTASGYNVYRNGSKVNTSVITGTAYTDSGLLPQTTYTYVLHSVDANGEGPSSPPVRATTTGTAPVCYTASNYSHIQARRAYVRYGYALANGSNQNMGLDNTFIVTTLKRTRSNYYVIGTCP